MAWIRVVAVVAAGLVGPVPVAAQVAADAWTVAAETFLRKLQEGDYAGAEGMLEPAARDAFASRGLSLQSVWNQLTAMGEVRGWTLAGVQEQQGYRVVEFNARFGERPLRLRLPLSAEGRVAGFFVLPAEPPPYTPPAYVDTASFREETLTIGGPQFPLGATMTVPNGDGPFPVVVLVHGSGPNDRDETVGPNRPFRDLAWGLATRGVAVLRYDKRTFAHGAVLRGAATVEGEVVADALSALEAARSHPATDAQRIHLLGHSLGGMLAPEIVTRDGKAAGMIVLAGSPRTLPELIRDQLTYLRTLPENASPQARATIDSILAGAERLQRREASPDETIMGAPASYFYDMVDRAPARHVRELKVPMLFLHGGRDYQVTERDLELWRELVGERDNVRFVLYDNLSHVFAEGTGTATPSEYLTRAGHVDRRVIEDVVQFVKGS
jgi:dienelactone hydrolase